MDQSDAELVIQDGGAQVKTSHDRKRPTQTSDFHGDTIVKKHVILVTQERDYLLAQFCDYENKLYFIQPLLFFKFRSLNCDHKKLLLNFTNCKIIFHWFFIVEVNFLSLNRYKKATLLHCPSSDRNVLSRVLNNTSMTGIHMQIWTQL